MPGVYHSTASAPGPRTLPVKLTDQIAIETPVRTRIMEFGRNGNGKAGACDADCPAVLEWPWSIKVDGQPVNPFNANRIEILVPKPGDLEHWIFVNGGGGWDHPVHLHFEEGVTIDRGKDAIGPTEKLVRKDVWRLRPGGIVKIQVRFGEFGGAYVTHCHNTAHEDFAMMLRFQVLRAAGTPQAVVTPTPNPTADGVYFTTPVMSAGADPRAATKS